MCSIGFYRLSSIAYGCLYAITVVPQISGAFTGVHLVDTK